MTQAQLTILESQLDSKGYKKWTTGKVGNEDWDWFKTMVLTTDPDGDPCEGYQMAFRVWDWTKYQDYYRPDDDDYGIEFWASPLSTDGRTAMNSSWHPIQNVDTFEKMAKDFYEMTKKYKK